MLVLVGSALVDHSKRSMGDNLVHVIHHMGRWLKKKTVLYQSLPYLFDLLHIISINSVAVIDALHDCLVLFMYWPLFRGFGGRQSSRVELLLLLSYLVAGLYHQIAKLFITFNKLIIKLRFNLYSDRIKKIVRLPGSYLLILPVPKTWSH